MAILFFNQTDTANTDSMSAIATLDFSNSIVGDREAMHIDRALRLKRPTFHHLKLRLNSITDEGFEAIGNDLKVNNSLQKLDFRCSGIPAQFISDALTVNNNLKFIDFSQNFTQEV